MPRAPKADQRAIDFGKGFLEEHERRPQPAEVAAGIGVTRMTVYTKCPKYKRWYREAARLEPRLFRKCVSRREFDAIVCLWKMQEETGETPLKRDVARCLRINPANSVWNAKSWPTFHSEYTRSMKLHKRPPDRERSPSKMVALRVAKGIKYQDEVFARSGRLVAVQPLAKFIGLRHFQNLYTPPYEKLITARRGIEAKIQRGNRGRLPTDLGERAEAAHRAYVEENGGIPTLKDLAGILHCSSRHLSTLQGLRVLRHADAKRLGVDLKSRPRVNVQPAIKALNEALAGGGPFPRRRDITDASGVSIIVQHRSKSFVQAYRKATKPLLAKTPWGKPKYAKEGEAIRYIQSGAEETGHVPPIPEITQRLQVGETFLFMRPVFRAAYRDLAAQYPAGLGNIKADGAGPPAGNGHAQTAPPPVGDAAAAGEQTQPTAAAGNGKPTPYRRRPPLEPKPLTPKQAEVVHIVGECKGNYAEAGRRMDLHYTTVKQQYEAAQKKLGKSAVKHRTRRLPADGRGQANVAADDDRRRFQG